MNTSHKPSSKWWEKGWQKWKWNQGFIQEISIIEGFYSAMFALEMKWNSADLVNYNDENKHFVSRCFYLNLRQNLSENENVYHGNRLQLFSISCWSIENTTQWQPIFSNFLSISCLILPQSPRSSFSKKSINFKGSSGEMKMRKICCWFLGILENDRIFYWFATSFP